MKVRLVTGADNALVVEVEWPLPVGFNKYPDVVTWGDRVFVPLDLPMPGAVQSAVAVYREAFLFAIPVK